MAVFLLALGPLSLTIVNYGVTFMFAVITLQQVCDKEEGSVSLSTEEENTHDLDDDKEKDDAIIEGEPSEKSHQEKRDDTSDKTSESSEMEDAVEDCDVCSESRIFNVIKRIRDKLSYTEDM